MIFYRITMEMTCFNDKSIDTLVGVFLSLTGLTFLS